ncbi:MAG: aminopeptidase P family N-terminal domain-containing protein [Chloroflexi bacterium]|nr:aminopeptidase P family N-terminal domain-containing protein [Chloroflexota bacterium]
MSRVELTPIDLPEFGLPTVQPTVSGDIYANRIATARERAAAVNLDALVVYGDREHFANLAYLTGYDPRFEEALLILAPGNEPTLVIGLEGWGYAELSPAPIRRVLYRSFSLMGMPRAGNPSLAEIFRNAGIRSGQRIGLIGWKYFDRRETASPQTWIEVPAFITDVLREVSGDASNVVNATSILMNATDGLRIINEVDQLAAFEFAATWASQAVRNVLFSVQPGMTELELSQRMNLPALPLAVHTMLSAGPRAAYGLPSPSMRVIQRGEYLTTAVGLWGALTSRAGFLVGGTEELPAAIRDYVDKLVAPYFATAAAWYETVGIGVTGGELYRLVHERIGDPFFGVALNPGHYIHLDEWVNSPVFEGSEIPLRSGMALQIDIIPATGTPYISTNIEDGIALADEALRAEFEQKYPEAWGRIQARRRFMQDVLGICLKPEVLPFSNIPAYLVPYLLNPRLALRMVE